MTTTSSDQPDAGAAVPEAPTRAPGSDATATVTVARELGLRNGQVEAVGALLRDGATVPFIARYRKEATDSLDEVAIGAIRDRLSRLAELDKRRAAIVDSLRERGLLDPELAAALRAAATLTALEDLYLPFRPKRRTRATMARERGLEPLARLLFAQDPARPVDPATAALPFVDQAAGVSSVAETLAGARDIMAEWVSEDAEARARLRGLFTRRGVLKSRVAKGKEADGAKFRDYFDWQEPLGSAPSHRVLALLRGEAEGFLTVRVTVPEEEGLAAVEQLFARAPGAHGDQVREAVQDGYRRLLAPSMETEARAAAKARADEEAIRVFAANLRELLLSPPLGPAVVLAIDPGFRTGCKTAVLDRQGRLLHQETVQPHQSARLREQAAERVRSLVSEHGVEAIAVGNGTAGRETEAFVRALELPAAVPLVMVNESGASVYSASAVAREELPDQDVTVRGAVSIGRRLQDPLAELVKIEPRSIGVGQYQHDVDQTALQRSLDDIVMSAVNSVGVEVNSASRSLLTYVSGLGPQLAANIVAYRDAHGPFARRNQLQQVPRLGPRAFEQAAGFLRIRDGDDPLDATAVHPERYPCGESHGPRPGRAGAGPTWRRHSAQTYRAQPLRLRRGGVAHHLRHPGRAGQAGPGPSPVVHRLQLRAGRARPGGPGAGHAVAGHRHERHGFRRLRRRGCPSRRPGPREPAGRSVRQGPGRRGEGPPAGDRHRPGRGLAATPHLAQHERTGEGLVDLTGTRRPRPSWTSPPPADTMAPPRWNHVFTTEGRL